MFTTFALELVCGYRVVMCFPCFDMLITWFSFGGFGSKVGVLLLISLGILLFFLNLLWVSWSFFHKPSPFPKMYFPFPRPEDLSKLVPNLVFYFHSSLDFVDFEQSCFWGVRFPWVELQLEKLSCLPFIPFIFLLLLKYQFSLLNLYFPLLKSLSLKF